MIDSGPDAATGDDDEPERSAAEMSMDLLLGLFFIIFYSILFSFPNFYFPWDEYFYFALKDFLLFYKDEDNYRSSLSSSSSSLSMNRVS